MFREEAAKGFYGKMHFGEFLRLMRRMLDSDFAGIASISSAGSPKAS